MRRRYTAFAALLLLAPIPTGSARANPMDPGLQQQLLAVYRHYNQDVTAGRLDDALALRSAAAQQALAAQFRTPKDRTDYLATAKQMVPDRLDVRHASVNNTTDRALVIALADKRASSGQAENELDISFVKEAGVWKLADLAVGPAPADVKRCTDTAYEAISAYDTSHAVAVAGRIERVDFAPDHTLLMVQAGDTEVCAFLPARAALQQHGLDPATLVPFRIADISGVTNRHDPQKLMVNNITVHEEE
jgi:hypothetical protein